MKMKIRPNLWIGDKDAYEVPGELKANEITSVLIVANEMPVPAFDSSGVFVYKMGLELGPNYGHVKDLACHIPKYMTLNGEVVMVQGVTGLRRTAYVMARVISELENKNIYEVFQELKTYMADLDLTKVYF